ncbi:MAG TPA: hypothetical protein VJ021_02315 [Thermoplasmata archaeon]|nr:hypothetical protein [Thermoplasmata archaeon]
MSFPRPEVDIRSPPADFGELVDWLERWSYRLVLLEEYPVSDLRAAVAEVERAVQVHRVSADRWILPLLAADEETSRGATVVRSDHTWFETSLEQFWWFFRALERDDHGGHRQALGQYGRVLGEALRRHLGDERRLEENAARHDRAPAP